MVKRSVITVDLEKCDGSGACVPSCPEGALKIVNGKLRVFEGLCDGLGACVGACPKGALTVEEREAEEFTLHLTRGGLKPNIKQPGWEKAKPRREKRLTVNPQEPSHLSQWPVKLELVNPHSQFFKDCELLVAADCTPIACRDFHREFLRGRKIVTGCPKFGDVNLYLWKLTEILKFSQPRALKVVRMEVPCCGGLRYIAEQAVKNATSPTAIEVEETVVGVNGKVLSQAGPVKR
ncbi:MAG: 4Fe-4S binding protein [Candidatus Bathyarchaeia archaeon]